MSTPGTQAYKEIIEARSVEAKRFRAVLDALPVQNSSTVENLVAAFIAGYTAGARDGASIAIQKMRTLKQ